MATGRSNRIPPATGDGETPPAAPEKSSGSHTGFVVLATAVSAAIVIIASFFPASRLWGVNHLAFLPAPARYAVITLLLASFFPLLARWVYRGVVATSGRMVSTEQRFGVLIIPIAIASVAVFHFLSSSTLLLGDGQLITKSFEAAAGGHETVIMRSPHAIATEERIAPGTTLLYYGAIKALNPLKKPPLFSMRLLNCVLGGFFVLLLLTAASSRRISRDARAWLVTLGLFSSSILLYFGYIENYTLPYLLVSVYMVLAYRAIHGYGSPWLALIPLAAAIYSHIQCVLFVPSFVYLLIWLRAPARRPVLVRAWMPVFVSAAILGVAGATAFPAIRRFYVPFAFSNESYGLFAPDHLVDVANEILMLLPILPTVIALAWIGRREDRGVSDPTRLSANPTSWFTHPVEWQFVWTILVPCVLYLLFFHPEIGMARDWDLFAMTSAAIIPLVLLILNRYQRATGADSDAVAGFATPALVIMVVTSVSWISVNASLPWTVERFQTILTYDKTHAAYAWENLAVLQHDGGDLKASIRTMERAVDVSHNPRQIVRLATYLEEDGRVDEAIAMLNGVLERRPDFEKARFRLVLIYEKAQNWERLLGVSRDGVKYNPDEALFLFAYGESLLRLGRKEEAMAVFRECRNRDLPPTVRKYLEETLGKDAGP